MKKKKFFSYLFMGLLAVGATGTVTSCKDYDDDINASNQRITQLESNVSSLETALNNAKTDLQSQIAAATQDYTSKIAAAQAQLQAAIDQKADASTVSALATQVADLTTDMNAKISALQSSLNSINEAISNLETTLTTKVDTADFNSAVKALRNSIDENGSNIAALQNQYAELRDGKADKTTVEELRTSLERSITNLENNKADKSVVEALQGIVDDLKDSKLDKTTFAEYQETVQNLLNQLEERINTNLQTNYATKSELASEVSALNTLIGQNTTDIQKLNEALSGKVSVTDFNKFQEAYNDAQVKYTAWKGDVDEKLLGLKNANQSIISDFGDSIAALKLVNQSLQDQIDALKLFQQSVESSDFQQQINNLEQSLGATAAVNYSNLKTTADSLATVLANTMQTVSDNNIAIEAIKDTLTSKYEALSTNISDEIVNMTVLVERQLTSLVLKPGYYFGGIEAVEVPALKEIPTQSQENDLTIDETWTTSTEEKVSQANNGVATYHVNPSIADLTGYEFAFYGNDPVVKEATRATNGIGFATPVYKNYADAEKAGYGKKDDGTISVPFTLNNTLYNETKTAGKTPMIALQMSKDSKKDGKRTVTSDYAMIQLTEYKDLIIADKSFEKDEQAEISDLKKQDLYGQKDASQTVRQLTSTVSAYSHIIGIEGQETLNLDDIVETHYTNEAGTHSVMTQETFDNLGLSYQFDLVKNQRNNFRHTEGEYATLDSETHVVSVNEALAAVAAGHQPIVRVLLLSKDGKVLQHGYIKLQISKFAYPVTDQSYAEAKPVTCDGVAVTDVNLNAAIKDLAEKNDFEPTSYVKSVELDKNQDNTLKQYKFDKDGNFVEVTGNDLKGTTVTTSLGGDALNTIDDNDYITWNLPKAFTDTITVDNEGKSKYPYETYVRVTNGQSLNSFIHLTIPAGTIVKAVATINADSKVAARWYKENGGQEGIERAELTEIHINTAVPATETNVDNTTRANISYNLNNAFNDQTPTFTLNDAFKSETVTTWTYKFINKPGVTAENKWIVTGASGTQYEIKVADDGKQLTATTVGTVQGSGAKATDHAFAFLSGTNNATLQIQTKNTDGQNRAVYDIINAFSHKQLAENETFKAYIGVTATINCQDADAGYFTARILRPIDLDATALDASGYDAHDNGYRFPVTDLFNNPIDWREQWSLNPINYWTYYGIDINADIDNALTDAALTQSERTAYQPGTVDADKIARLGKVTSAGLDFTLEPNTATNLNRDAVLVYKNNGATVGAFHIYVPLTVDYFWGYKWNVGYAVLNIGNTTANAKRQ